MSISFSGTTLTFSDSTTMTTAAVAGPPGPAGSPGSAGSTGPTGPTGAAGTNASVVTTYGAVGTYVVAYYVIGTGNTYIRPSCTVGGACLKRVTDAVMSGTGCNSGGAMNSTIRTSGAPAAWVGSSGCSTALSLSGTWRSMTTSYQKYACTYTGVVNLWVRTV